MLHVTKLYYAIRTREIKVGNRFRTFENLRNRYELSKNWIVRSQTGRLDFAHVVLTWQTEYKQVREAVILGAVQTRGA